MSNGVLGAQSSASSYVRKSPPKDLKNVQGEKDLSTSLLSDQDFASDAVAHETSTKIDSQHLFQSSYSLAVAVPALPLFSESASSSKSPNRQHGVNRNLNANSLNSEVNLVRKYSLKDVVTEPNIDPQKPKDAREKEIVERFNQGNTESFVTESTALGTRIQRDQYRLVQRNNTPELVGYTQTPVRLKKYFTGTTEDLGVYKKNELFFGAHGKYIVNVKPGTYVKAWDGNQPLVLAAGTHVVNNPNFRLDKEKPEDAVVLQSQPYITHGNLWHVVRVPQGKIAKVWVDQKPHILEPSDEPYVFHSSNFVIEQSAQNTPLFLDQASAYIQHGNSHILRIPQGKIAKVWEGQTPKILVARDEPYVFNSPYFRIEAKNVRNGQAGAASIQYFEDQSQLYIQHGNLHFLRVPKGKVAKVWEGQTPRILDASDEPYQFNSPYFSIDKNARGELDFLVDATTEIIVHGALKRLLPRTGNVVVTYNAGKLLTYAPSEEGKPILIESPEHEVLAQPLTVSTQTILFPSERTKKERTQEYSAQAQQQAQLSVNSSSRSSQQGESVDYSKYIYYEVFRTSDSCDIGVKLLVVYHIDKPELVLKKLGSPENIEPHIEKLVVADMGNVIQQCSSQDFTRTDQTKIGGDKIQSTKSQANGSSIPAEPGEKDINVYLQDSLRESLKKDFSVYGIVLERLNIETPTVLKVSEQSKQFTETNVKVAQLEQQAQIVKAQADMDAAKKQIEQTQENNRLTTAAAARNKVLTSEAEAKFLVAQKEAEIVRLNADAEKYKAQKAAEAEAERISRLGQAWLANPALYQLEMAKIQSLAISSIKTAMVSPDDAFRIFRLGGGGNQPFFQADQSQNPPGFLNFNAVNELTAQRADVLEIKEDGSSSSKAD